MPETNETTSLESVADHLVSKLFDGGASANEVIVPDITPKAVKEPKLAEEYKTNFDPSNNGINNPNETLSTSELIGDIIKSTKNTKVDENAATPKDDNQTPGPQGGTPQGEFGFIQDLFKEQLLVPFDDDAPIASVNDFKDLLKANIEEAKRTAKEEAKAEELADLPDPVKYLVDYAKNGGQDFQTLFNLLARSTQAQEYNLETESGQVGVVRQYYQDLGWEDDAIEEQINILKDAGPERLKNASERFKSKVDEFHNQRLEAEIEQQKQLQAQAEDMRKSYIQNLTSTLKKGTLGGLKLTRDDQKDIYSALVEERYPTYGGGTTNRLGALLNKVQYQEPNFELLGEVLLLLSDRDKYYEKVRSTITADVTSNQVRKIKTEQGLKGTGSELQQPKRAGLRRLDGISNPFK